MPDKSSKSNLLLAGAGIAVGLIVLSFYYTSNTSDEQSTERTTAIPHVTENTIPIPDLQQNERPETEELASSDAEFEALKNTYIEKIISQFGSVIGDVAVQVSLKDFMDSLMKTYPDRGAELFEAVIRGAFPELADQILQVIATMRIYDEWLLDNMLTLNDMDLLTQRGELWKKREALFGEDAKKIWSEELTAQEDRRAVLQKTVLLLDQSFDTTMNERIFILQTAYNEQYDETVENVVFDSKGVLAQVLFGFDAVQKDLESLSNEDRQAEIDQIRRTMGFEEESIVMLAKKDQQRHKRWENGYQYTAAREELAANLSGDEYDEALQALQVKYFKHEAPTIAREEQDDFYRFQRPRVYGRN